MNERQGQAWSAAEERRLTEAFRAGATIEELAMAHQRSRGAVRRRLERLGVIECANGSERNTLLAPGLTLGVKTESNAGLPAAPESSGSPEPNDGPPRESATTDVPAEETPSRPEVVPDLASVAASIDELIFSLQTLKADAVDGKLQEHKVTAVTSAYERFDTDLLSTVHQPQPGGDVCHDDPLPERLRDALRNLVRVCVPKLKDRYVAVRALGLADDGSPVICCRAAGSLEPGLREVARSSAVKACKDRRPGWPITSSSFPIMPANSQNPS